jgi:hypothetical protein
MTILTRALAETFAGLALSHIGREFPYKMDHVLTGSSLGRSTGTAVRTGSG